VQLRVTVSSILLSSSLSNTSAMNGRRLMGLYDVTSVGGGGGGSMFGYNDKFKELPLNRNVAKAKYAGMYRL
jgi:hypothetical protein